MTYLVPMATFISAHIRLLVALSDYNTTEYYTQTEHEAIVSYKFSPILLCSWKVHVLHNGISCSRAEAVAIAYDLTFRSLICKSFV